ncbi:hypothetical protein G039_0310325 [Pseudomonas aeruginosa VRFPA01]|nr:hypothetical protein G039_0310325 [Pseudomonas aeruginosa VRFPA01]
MRTVAADGAEQAPHVVDESLASQVRTADIDAEVIARPQAQLRQVGSDQAEDVAGQVADHAIVFSQRNEDVRPHLAVIRTPPAHQRLDAPALPRIEPDDGLIDHMELPGPHGPVHVANQRQAATAEQMRQVPRQHRGENDEGRVVPPCIGTIGAGQRRSDRHPNLDREPCRGRDGATTILCGRHAAGKLPLRLAQHHLHLEPPVVGSRLLDIQQILAVDYRQHAGSVCVAARHDHRGPFRYLRRRVAGRDALTGRQAAQGLEGHRQWQVLQLALQRRAVDVPALHQDQRTEIRAQHGHPRQSPQHLRTGLAQRALAPVQAAGHHSEQGIQLTEDGDGSHRGLAVGTHPGLLKHQRRHEQRHDRERSEHDTEMKETFPPLLADLHKCHAPANAARSPHVAGGRATFG